ncbi:MAG TPA: hypothetical protein VID74_01965 [Gemmatimonadales bacterium]
MLITAFAWPAATLVVTMIGVGGRALISVVWSYFAWKRDPNAQGRNA